ncbi:Mucin-19 (plasmid) [Streptomyces canus]|uniref:Mucin-19 n=1 Tax=Streptomyces canus TaxID=58343 RepID=UPI002F918DA1|nr:Mucin-19 [Streptomyces canus]
MDAKSYNAGLAELRELRDEIRPLERQLKKLLADRDKKIAALGEYEKARADRLATSAGLSVIDVVALVPRLGPQTSTSEPESDTAAPEATADSSGAEAAAQEIKDPADSAASDLRTPPVAEEQNSPEQDEGPAPATGTELALTRVAAQSAEDAPVRELPSIPAGAEGDRWFRQESNLVSKAPNFQQAVRQMAFLDTATGVLVWSGGTARLELGRASVAEILTAVYATVPAAIERIYVTGGDPWHRDAGRYEFLRDAVAAWLNGPLPEGWQVESSRGKDHQAGHLVHPRNPVGRWQQGKDQHTEIRSVSEWFDPEGASPEIVRQAFVELWKALREKWKDVVLMGSPSQTGRDLWTRTIPERGRWADGYPVLSQEIRGLLHATAGQGRTELITPPRIPERVPAWYELDRTFAYAKHCSTSPTGVPRRMTKAAIDSLSDKEKNDLLYSPAHWQVKVTIPEGWEHVGLLPAPAPGERSWHYPYEPGQTFTTWTGGAELNVALRNPIMPWKVEILDGLVWEKEQRPLQEWATKLRSVWNHLLRWSTSHGDESMRWAFRLAARAVRSILLYGIGTFAQRPKITTGSVELNTDGSTPEIPDGAQLTGITDTHVTWQRYGGFARDPYAHPEWAAAVWSSARAALLSTHQSEIIGQDEKTGDVKVRKGAPAGALHLPAGSILAFRTDAIYTTVRPDWPYSGQPGDYRLKGAMPWEQPTPTNDEEFFYLQGLGRQALEAEGL